MYTFLELGLAVSLTVLLSGAILKIQIREWTYVDSFIPTLSSRCSNSYCFSPSLGNGWAEGKPVLGLQHFALRLGRRMA
jgi:hypothetical protein